MSDKNKVHSFAAGFEAYVYFFYSLLFITVYSLNILINFTVACRRTFTDRGRFLPRCMDRRRGMAIRMLSVCLSVRLSVCKRVLCGKQKESSARIIVPYERSFSLVS